MGVTLIELILLAATLGVIAYPLARRSAGAPDGGALTESEYTDLLYRKEATYIAIKDLDFDYRTGKVDDGDYRSMKAGMEKCALELLRQIEDYKAGVTAPPAVKAQGEKFCHECGAAVERTHKFCAECGAKTSPA